MKIVFTAGVYDLMHEGHVNLFEQMRKKGDLTIAVIHDGFTTFKNKRKLPIESLEKRTRNLIDTGLVDMIRFTFDPVPVKEFQEIIDRFKEHELLFMRGDDWIEFPGIEIVKANNIPIEYIQYTKGISSSKLRTEL